MYTMHVNSEQTMDASLAEDSEHHQLPVPILLSMECFSMECEMLLNMSVCQFKTGIMEEKVIRYTSFCAIPCWLIDTELTIWDKFKRAIIFQSPLTFLTWPLTRAHWFCPTNNSMILSLLHLKWTMLSGNLGHIISLHCQSHQVPSSR